MPIGCKNCRWKNEERCRNTFENLFPGYKFKKCRPGFLEKLEFDGYCSKLSLAFEFDGKQHFEWVKKFHKTKKKFENQKLRDRKKNRLCIENGVKLIRIPYNFADTGDSLEIYVVKALETIGYEIETKLEPKYIVVLPEELREAINPEYETKCSQDETDRKNVMHIILEKLDLSNSNRKTTREKIIMNKDYWDNNQIFIRKTFGLTSKTKVTTMRGYLAFLNSVFRAEMKCKLIKNSAGIYEMRSIQN